MSPTSWSSSPLRAARELRAEFPRVVLVLAAGDLVASFGFSLFFPFLTIYLVQRLGSSAAEAGLVVAAYSVCSIPSGLIGGWLADRIGRRPVLLGSVSVTAVIVVAMAFATEVWSVTVLMLILGCIDPAFIPAARAAVADTVAEPRRPRAFGLLAVANAVGWIAGPVIGAGLSALGYPLLFGISGALIAAYTGIGLLWLPETLPQRGRGAGQPDSRPSSSALEPEPLPGRAAFVAGGLADPPEAVRDSSGEPGGDAPARRAVFILLLPLLVAIYGLSFLWVTTLPIHAASSLEVPTPVWGVLFGINGLLIVTLQLRVATRLEHGSKLRLMALATAFYAVGLATVAPLSPENAIPGLALTIVFVTLGEIVLMPVVPSLVADLSPTDRRGAYQGTAMAANGIGSALGPVLGGAALDAGAGGLLWLGAAGGLALVGAALVGLASWSDRLWEPVVRPSRRAT